MHRPGAWAVVRGQAIVQGCNERGAHLQYALCRMRLSLKFRRSIRIVSTPWHSTSSPLATRLRVRDSHSQPRRVADRRSRPPVLHGMPRSEPGARRSRSSGMRSTEGQASGQRGQPGAAGRRLLPGEGAEPRVEAHSASMLDRPSPLLHHLPARYSRRSWSHAPTRPRSCIPTTYRGHMVR